MSKNTNSDKICTYILLLARSKCFPFLFSFFWGSFKGLLRVAGKLELNVQVLICTDYSIYQLHESIVTAAGTWSAPSAMKRAAVNKHNRRLIDERAKEKAIIEHIKAYYTEVMDQVNERYRNSFTNDPYLNINVELVGFYIAMVRLNNSNSSRFTSYYLF